MTTLSTEMMAGQRLMVGFDGTDFNDDLEFLIGTLQVGGLILFSRNLGAPEQIRQLCRDCQSCATRCGLPPLFIAIDQEGGPVARLKPPFTQFPGNPAMKHPDDAADFARVTAGELTDVGINMDMAPVLDVAPEGEESVMAGRSFGGDPDWVSTMGTTMIDHFQQRGIMAVAKHFPGIGRTVLDSHRALPDLDIDPQTLADMDLVPFKAAIHGNVAGIMLSHIRYTQLDPDLPASLSRIIAMDLLRNQMGYQGVIMTDDLDMGSIQKYYPITESIRHILHAEIDLALICHKGPAIETAFEEILRITTDDPTAGSANDQSLSRIIALKAKYLTV